MRFGEDLSEMDAYVLMKEGAKHVLLQCSETKSGENLLIANGSVWKKTVTYTKLLKNTSIKLGVNVKIKAVGHAPS